VLGPSLPPQVPDRLERRQGLGEQAPRDLLVADVRLDAPKGEQRPGLEVLVARARALAAVAGAAASSCRPSSMRHSARPSDRPMTSRGSSPVDASAAWTALRYSDSASRAW
jgi:hypothetical protein